MDLAAPISNFSSFTTKHLHTSVAYRCTCILRQVDNFHLRFSAFFLWPPRDQHSIWKFAVCTADEISNLMTVDFSFLDVSGRVYGRRGGTKCWSGTMAYDWAGVLERFFREAFCFFDLVWDRRLIVGMELWLPLRRIFRAAVMVGNGRTGC